MYRSDIYFLFFLLASIQEVHSRTFSGCFMQPANATKHPHTSSLGFGYKIGLSVGHDTVQKCIDHCTLESVKYAVVETEGTELFCYCGSERAFKRLGTPFAIDPSTPCHNSLWSLITYVAQGDVSSQYIGCYNEVSDPLNMASNANKWIDWWDMSPAKCINYCALNGASYANLREGDACTCGYSYAKHGQAAEASCDTPCTGSAGERCGGALVNSVYSTLGQAGAVMNHTAPIILKSQTFPAVLVPQTQELMQKMLSIQEEVKLKLPIKDIEILKQHLDMASGFIQYILDMQAPLNAMQTAVGLSLSSEVKSWLPQQFPKELQQFVDVVKRSQTFMNTNVAQVTNFVNQFSANGPQLKVAISQGLLSLNSYISYGILSEGIDRTYKLATQMVSSSRTCLPLLTSNKNVMVQNFEEAAVALMTVPGGIDQYLENIRKPYSTSAAAYAKRPHVDPATWRKSLKEITSGWQSFMVGNGVKLNKLLHSRYAQTCSNAVVGRRSACQAGTRVSLLEMLKTPGDNKAKQQVRIFVEKNREAFAAFDWSQYEKKMSAIYKDMQLIQNYLVSAHVSSKSSIDELVTTATSFKYYQSCVADLSALIRSVCHTASAPIPSNVVPLQC